MTLGEEGVTHHFSESSKKNQNVVNHLTFQTLAMKLLGTVKLVETKKGVKSAAQG